MVEWVELNFDLCEEERVVWCVVIGHSSVGSEWCTAVAVVDVKCEEGGEEEEEEEELHLESEDTLLEVAGQLDQQMEKKRWRKKEDEELLE